MGGKALKHLGVKRLSENEYLERVRQFNKAIYFNGLVTPSQVYFTIPAHVPGKEDYGDLDVVYTYSGFARVDFPGILQKKFESKGFVRNGNCTSIEWYGFQVDLIRVKPEEYDFATHYYAHGTHAALLGRLASYYGFKLGWGGLYYTLGTKNAKHDVLLTRKWEVALLVLGYDTTLPAKEVFTKEGVFEHIESSKYFCKDIFKSTRPDRNYGFQEEFYDYALKSDCTKSFERSQGWKMLLFFGFLKTLTIWLRLKLMQVQEFFRPIKRFFRKTYHKYVKPFAFKVQGWL